VKSGLEIVKQVYRWSRDEQMYTSTNSCDVCDDKEDLNRIALQLYHTGYEQWLCTGCHKVVRELAIQKGFLW